MIINIDQSEDLTSGAVEPWRLEIDDHQTGRSSLVTMAPGEMVCGLNSRPPFLSPSPLFLALFLEKREVKWIGVGEGEWRGTNSPRATQIISTLKRTQKMKCLDVLFFEFRRLFLEN